MNLLFFCTLMFPVLIIHMIYLIFVLGAYLFNFRKFHQRESQKIVLEYEPMLFHFTAMFFAASWFILGLEQNQGAILLDILRGNPIYTIYLICYFILTGVTFLTNYKEGLFLLIGAYIGFWLTFKAQPVATAQYIFIVQTGIFILTLFIIAKALYFCYDKHKK